MPKAARAATVVALVLALVCGVSSRSGPIMLLGFCFAALLSAMGMLLRRAWDAWGFSLLLVCSIIAILLLAITGQSTGGFLQTVISLSIYAGLAALFFFAGLGLSLSGAKRGTPIPWILLALAFSVPFLVFRPATVPSVAMENTIMMGDFLLIDRFAGSHPAFGELIAFHYPLDKTQILVRRVVGLPGDRLRVTDGTLYRNGSVVKQNIPANVDLQSSGREMMLHNVVNGEIIVPPAKYFVVGDSRDHAFDSLNWGFVDAAEIAGKPKLIYDSLAGDAAHAPTRRWDRVLKTL